MARQRPAGVRRSAPGSPLELIIACFHELTAENVALALASILHALRPDVAPEPSEVPEPVAHRGYWHPETGVNRDWAEHAAARGERPRSALGPGAVDLLPGAGRHRQRQPSPCPLVAALEEQGVEVVGWLGTIGRRFPIYRPWNWC